MQLSTHKYKPVVYVYYILFKQIFSLIPYIHAANAEVITWNSIVIPLSLLFVQFSFVMSLALPVRLWAVASGRSSASQTVASPY